MQLTKDTEKVFKIIYCEYKRRRKAGFTKSNSIVFEDGSIYRLDAFSNWLRPDIALAIQELKKANYLKENIIGDTSITENGIAYMESKPADFFKDISNLFNVASLFI